MPEFRKFITGIVRAINAIDGTFVNIEFHKNFNIVRLFTFMNMIDDLYKIIDIDYDSIDDEIVCPNTI